MLKFFLSENTLTEKPDDYMAFTLASGSYNKNSIIDLMLKRGNLLTKTDILAVLNSFEEVISDLIEEGNNINTPLFNTSFSISGTFNGPLDSFDSTRHKLNVNFSKGILIRKSEQNLIAHKTESNVSQPTILEVKDVESKTTNATLTPRGALQIFGSNIRIAGDSPNVGIWFIPEEGEPIKAGTTVLNKPSSLIVMIPEGLEPGIYKLQIITHMGVGGKTLKGSRSFTFEKLLTVL